MILYVLDLCVKFPFGVVIGTNPIGDYTKIDAEGVRNLRANVLF